MLSGIYVNQQALAALTQLILILALMGPLLFRAHRSRATFFYVGVACLQRGCSPPLY